MFKTELKNLASNVARLSTLLTRERESLPAAYLKDAGLRKAYIEYFLPSNLYKIHIPLKELSLHPKGLFKKDKLRILDIGSGPGTATLGALDFFSIKEKRPILEFTAVDPVAENLRDAEALFKDRGPKEATLTTLKSGIERIEAHIKGSFDIIILSNLLNEVAHNDAERIHKRVEILKGLINRFLSFDGSCIIIEPALRETSREMLMVRDGLLDEGLHIYSPCLTGDKCPALDNPKDWCHEDVPWEPPAIVKEVDQLTGLRKDSLKFSYLILREDDLSLADICGEDSYRVVSEPLISKGKMEFYVCGKEGRRLIARLDKDKTNLNGTFDDLRRGDVVRLKGVVDTRKRLKVGKDSSISLEKFLDKSPQERY
ncbi:MAG: small ribosomal subunit Rsm22 family protein [Deltaproteobacteria bacterium]|nr:small ribosomal subunit Rsm22 family protein [Deltaproteobacteria bacterium]